MTKGKPAVPVSREGEIPGAVTERDGEDPGIMDAMNAPRHARRRAGAITLAAVTLLVAAVLLAYAAPASYESLSGLAARNGVPIPRFFPVGVDGGLIGFIVIDIGLTMWGHPVGWLRQVARLFGLSTVAFNVWAGLPDVAGAAMRVIAPALIVLLAEAVRTVLLRRQRESGRIPLSRWLLAFGPTFRMWRRMKLWRVSDYATAVDLEISRLRSCEQLRGKFGEKWESRVPADLAWMLAEGVRMPEALRMVGELCAPSPALTHVPAVTLGKRPATARASTARKRRAGAGAETIDSQVQALTEYMSNPSINGRQMADALGLSHSRGRALLAKVKQSAPDTGPIPVVRETR